MVTLKSPPLLGLLLALSYFFSLQVIAESNSELTEIETDKNSYAFLCTRSWLHFFCPCLVKEPTVIGYNSKGEQKNFSYSAVIKQIRKEEKSENSSCISGKCIWKCLVSCLGTKLILTLGFGALGLLVGLYRSITDWEKYQEGRGEIMYDDVDQSQLEFLPESGVKQQQKKLPVKKKPSRPVKVVYIPGKTAPPSVLSLGQLFRAQLTKYQLFFGLEVVLVAALVVAYFVRQRRSKQAKMQMARKKERRKKSIGSKPAAASAELQVKVSQKRKNNAKRVTKELEKRREKRKPDKFKSSISSAVQTFRMTF